MQISLTVRIAVVALLAMPVAAQAPADLASLAARLAQLEKEPDASPTDLALAHRTYGGALAGLGRRAEALVQFQRAVDALDGEVEPASLDMRAARFELAEALGSSGDDLAARPHLEAACIGPTPNSLAVDELGLSARHTLALVLRDLGELRDSVAVAQSLAADRDRLGLGPTVESARLAVHVGMVREGLDELPQAASSYTEALERLESTDEHAFCASIRIQLASVYGRLGDFERALVVQERALADLERHPPDDPRVSLAVRGSYATTLNMLGRFGASRNAFEQVVAEWRDLVPDHHLDLLRAYANLGLVLWNLGEFATTEAIHESVLETALDHHGEAVPQVQRSRLVLASIRAARGDHENAALLLHSALAVLDATPGAAPERLHARMALAQTLLARGDAPAAANEAARAVDDAEMAFGTGSPLAVQASLVLARATLAQGGLAGARDRFASALEALEASAETNVHQRAHAATQLALVLARLGDRLALRELVERQAELLEEQLRLRLADPELAVAERDGALSGPLDALLSVGAGTGAVDEGVGSPETALLLIELGRGVPLRPNAPMAPADGAGSVVESAARLSEAVRRGASTDELVELRELRDRAVRRRIASAPRVPVPGIADVRAALQSDDVAVGFRRYRRTRVPEGAGRASTELAWTAVVLDAGGARRVELGPDGPIAELVDDLRTCVDDDLGWHVEPEREQRRAEAICARLREQLWDPLDLNGTGRVHVALDGLLELVPFEEFAEAEVVRWSTLLQLGSRHRRPQTDEPPHLLVLFAPPPDRGEEGRVGADPPVARSDEAALPSAVAEADELIERFQSRFPHGTVERLSDPGDLRRFARSAASADWMHVATHGRFEPFPPPEEEGNARVESPLLDAVAGVAASGVRAKAAYTVSPLSFASLDTGGGGLSGEVLASLDLAGCRLVVLSACDSSRGYAVSGRGLASLQRAFAVAGAESAIGARWRIGDRAARAFMAGFYELLWSGDHGPLGALTETRRRLAAERRRDGSPRWAWRDLAAWTLLGEPDGAVSREPHAPREPVRPSRD